jgi:glycosyltransferase involved in cell wall biosynthesis
MKILHLLYESWGDHFGIGGVGIRAYEIHRYLKDHHEITLLCKKYPRATDGEREGLNHIFVGEESESLTKTLLAYAYYAAKYVRRHGDEYDIIIEDFSPAIPTFLHAFTKKPVVLQIQEHTGKLYFRKYNPFYALALFLMEMLRPRFYDNFVFVNPETIKKFSLKDVKHIAIISNGISSELLNIPSWESDYILYLGRIDIYKKGLDILLDAYREFVKRFPEVRLVIAGEWRDRYKFDALLMELPRDIRKNIEMAGWVSGHKKEDVLSKALFAVLPSRHESQPIAAFEVLASGKAVVVSDIPEFNFVTECGAGIPFRTGNALSLAHAMTDLTVSDKREVMGERGRDWVKDFTWGKIALRFESFLLQLIGREHEMMELRQ